MKRLLIPALLVCPLWAGCLKFKEEVQVMPDGAGRIVLSISSKETGEENKMSMSELMSEDPDKMDKTLPGIVAMSRPVEEKKDGWTTVTVEFFFDDLNKVKLVNEDDGKVMQEFAFRKEGDGHVVEFKSGAADELGADLGGAAGGELPPEAKKQMEEMVKQMLAGFELRIGVLMPGGVKDAGAFKDKEGRRAAFAIGEKDIAGFGDFKKFEAVKSVKIVSGPADVPSAEQAAFKAAFEKAKAEWPQLKKEMKANFEKKAKEKKD